MKTAIFGGAGRMGRAVVSEIHQSKMFEIGAVVEHADHPLIGRDVGLLLQQDPIGISVTSDATLALETCETAIDFSAPKATMEHLRIAATLGREVVVGTTGLHESDRQEMVELAERTAILHSENMSLAGNVMLLLAEQAAKLLDQDFDVEIYEMHHRDKIDAPSGTALMYGRAIAAARGVLFSDAARFGRAQTSYLAKGRIKGEIGFASQRGGDVIGDHSIHFAGTDEMLTLTHRATDRHLFARGAVFALSWLEGQRPGLYSMRDAMFGLSGFGLSGFEAV
jgi:4-hydroxy-tetrahydrodipicolinate reductase